MRPAQRVAADVAQESRTLQLVGVGQARSQCRAGAVRRHEEPAVHVADDVRVPDLNWRRRYSAEGVERTGDASTGADRKWPAASERIHAGGLEAADDVAKDSVVHEFAVAPERQFVNVARHNAMRRVEVAWPEP